MAWLVCEEAGRRGHHPELGFIDESTKEVVELRRTKPCCILEVRRTTRSRRRPWWRWQPKRKHRHCTSVDLKTYAHLLACHAVVPQLGTHHVHVNRQFCKLAANPKCLSALALAQQYLSSKTVEGAAQNHRCFGRIFASYGRQCNLHRQGVRCRCEWQAVCNACSHTAIAFSAFVYLPSAVTCTTPRAR